MFRARDRDVIEVKAEDLVAKKRQSDVVKLENVNGVEYVVLDDQEENVENSPVVQPDLPPALKTPPKSRAEKRAEIRAKKEAKLSPTSRQWLKIKKKLKSKSFGENVVKEQLAILSQPVEDKRRKRKSDFDPFGEAQKQAEATSSAAKKAQLVNVSSDPRVIVDPHYVPQRINNGLPDTPPNYWDLDFPSIEQQRELGLIIEADSPLIKKPTRKHVK